MSIQGEVLRHPINGSKEQTWDGFSWPALLFGVIWLLIKGLYGHFLINVVLLIVTGGLAAPLIWIIYACIGNGAHKSSLLKKGYLTDEQWAKKDQASAQVQPPTQPAQTDPVTRLRELADLREKGILTEEEFAQQKAKLLGA